jgi:aryl-alcohol dehydrogenase-like predicted oxidoreductase
MSFGDTSRGFNEWALDDEGAEPIFRQAVELGITFWDTANAYGTSEEIVEGAVHRTDERMDPVHLDAEPVLLSPARRRGCARHHAHR